MPRHRRHRHSSFLERFSKRASVPRPRRMAPCFRRFVRFPRPVKEITTSLDRVRSSIHSADVFLCEPPRVAPVGVSISLLAAARSSTFLSLSFSLLRHIPVHSELLNYESESSNLVTIGRSITTGDSFEILSRISMLELCLDHSRNPRCFSSDKDFVSSIRFKSAYFLNHLSRRSFIKRRIFRNLSLVTRLQFVPPWKLVSILKLPIFS